MLFISANPPTYQSRFPGHTLDKLSSPSSKLLLSILNDSGQYLGILSSELCDLVPMTYNWSSATCMEADYLKTKAELCLSYLLGDISGPPAGEVGSKNFLFKGRQHTKFLIQSSSYHRYPSYRLAVWEWDGEGNLR